MGSIGYPETSVYKYQSALLKISEELRSLVEKSLLRSVAGSNTYNFHAVRFSVTVNVGPSQDFSSTHIAY